MSTGTRVSNERGAELEKWREAKRSLVFASDVDGAYSVLQKNVAIGLENLRIMVSTGKRPSVARSFATSSGG